MTQTRDDLFIRHNITWRRHWIGGADGRYEWHADDGRMIAWGERGQYYAGIGGAPCVSGPSLRYVMDKVVITKQLRRAA